MTGQLVVGIADMKTAGSAETLVTYALGSCVGVCIYDPAAKTGALGHILLPQKPQGWDGSSQFRYADTCIPAMLEALRRLGCARAALRAKIAGGAQMFSVSGNHDFGRIGDRNVEEVKKILGEQRVPVLASDTGENWGRTLYFSPADGKMTVKSFAKGETVF